MLSRLACVPITFGEFAECFYERYRASGGANVKYVAIEIRPEIPLGDRFCEGNVLDNADSHLNTERTCSYQLQIVKFMAYIEENPSSQIRRFLRKCEDETSKRSKIFQNRPKKRGGKKIGNGS